MWVALRRMTPRGSLGSALSRGTSSSVKWTMSTSRTTSTWVGWVVKYRTMTMLWISFLTWSPLLVCASSSLNGLPACLTVPPSPPLLLSSSPCASRQPDRWAAWDGGVCSRDALWPHPCALRPHQQRNECHGTPLSLPLSLPPLSLSPHSAPAPPAWEVQERGLWEMSPGVLCRAALPAHGPVRHPQNLHCEDLLPQVWRHLLPPLKVPRQYPHTLLILHSSPSASSPSALLSTSFFASLYLPKSLAVWILDSDHQTLMGPTLAPHSPTSSWWHTLPSSLQSPLRVMFHGSSASSCTRVPGEDWVGWGAVPNGLW